MERYRREPAISQAPPPHTHNWVPAPLITQPGVGISGNYFRVGDSPIGVDTTNQGDEDTCTGSGVCSYYGRVWQDVTIVGWSDGGAGGQFGRMNGTQFETCSPDLVTHYKLPADPKNVSITATMDDVNGTGIPGADDPARTSTARVITVWDFTIEGPDASWRPLPSAAGQDVTLSIEIRPATDQAGASMAANMEAEMFDISNNAGTCGNSGDPAPPAGALDLDLPRPPNQAYWNLGPNPPQLGPAITTDRYTTVPLVARCHDYGAWGKAKVKILDGPLAGKLARDKRQPPPKPPYREYCNIPYDEDGDHIADGHDANVGENGFTGANRDNELIYANNPNRGDGLSDYEEYRGMVIQGTWTTTGRDCPDVFIHDRDNLGTGGFAQTGLHINLVAAADSNAAGEITFNSPSVTRPCPGGVAQRRILLIDCNDALHPTDFGYTEPGSNPHVPYEASVCKVYVSRIATEINQRYPDPTQNAAMYSKLLTMTITHELAHAGDMSHHFSTGSHTCFMRYIDWSLFPIGENYSQFCTSTTPLHLSGEMQLRR